MTSDPFFTGKQALYQNSTGSENTATGVNALKSNLDGNFNTANGMHSLISNTGGSFNVASGRYALSGNTTGTGNTAIGCIAGDNNQTGNHITCIGYDADVAGVALTNATAIGYGAVVNTSNKIVLGNASATTVGGYGNWTNYSDRRLKENIHYQNNLGLNFIVFYKMAGAWSHPSPCRTFNSKTFGCYTGSGRIIRKDIHNGYSTDRKHV